MDHALEPALARAERFLRQRVTPAVHRHTAALTVTAWEAPGEPVPFATAVARDFRPFPVGTRWGRPWGTTWFRVTGRVPETWTTGPGHSVEVVVDLGFDTAQPGFQAEGLVHTLRGEVLKAVEPRNATVTLALSPGDEVGLLIEAAANPDVAGGYTFAPTALGLPETAGDQLLYTLRRMDVALLDIQVWELAQDLTALLGLARELSPELPRRARILVGLDKAMGAMDPDDVAGTAAAGRAVLAPLLASPAHASAHRVHAVGHAHIDSAWLWPLRETRRKVARTFANAMDLIERHPDFTFVASSAQHYQWVKEDHPNLYERLRRHVAAGRFVPVGGMWVECDLNLPGGESLARQFVHGKKFFAEEFGVDPLEAWVPDTFGYNAAFPQIATAAGIRWFLTQKISWNDTNTFPHHTFWWEGIDGTRLFTHFPPMDTYNAQLTAAELHLAEAQFAEKGWADTSLAPFGWGDGGGGPTREMVAAATRWRDTEGSPRVEHSTPRRFFEAAQAEFESPPVWHGELYLELHRGTATTQAALKRGNRRCEHLLREAELWAATAAVRADAPYPAEEIDAAWKTVLLLQFHDILPGSSIAWVHREARERYARTRASLERIVERSVRALLGPGEAVATANAGPYDLPGAASGSATTERPPAPAGRAVRVLADGSLTLESDALRVRVDTDGLLTSVYDRTAEREVVPEGTVGNLLQLHRDTPAAFDAWDIDSTYRDVVTDLRDAAAVEPAVTGDGGAAVRIERTFGDSRVVEVLSLSPGGDALDIDLEIDWHEREKLLKLAFPLDVHAGSATSEIPYGHLARGVHRNTSWDAARFETVAHRWVHVAESGYGVALANDATYGYDITSAPSARGSHTLVRASLLRAPRFPDPGSDTGGHKFRFALRPGADVAAAVAEGYRLNLPARRVGDVGAGHVPPLVTSGSPGIVVEAVKLAEDGSGDVVVRLYEAHGAHTAGELVLGFAHTGLHRTDLLERPTADARAVTEEGGAVRLRLRPFQIVTLRTTPLPVG